LIPSISPPYNTNPGDLYSLAVYVIFPAAIVVFVTGFAYKIARLLLALRKKKWVASRERTGVINLILGAINVYIYPPLYAMFKNRKNIILGLAAVHLIGLIPLIFLLGQHIAFYAYYFPPYKILWPLSIPLSPATGSMPVLEELSAAATSGQQHSLWGPLTIILNGDVLAAIALAAIGIKIGEKTYGLIRHGHRPSDLLMLIHLALILVTGVLAAHHEYFLSSTSIVSYRIILGAHITLAGLFLALIPFTKYWHFVFGMFFGKFVEWVDRTWMRGAALEGGRLVPVRRRRRARR
jgi:hypothetical protein